MRLLDRLKTEFDQQLENENINYPHLVGRICNELEQISYVGDMTYRTWLDLKYFFNVDSPYDLFDEIK